MRTPRLESLLRVIGFLLLPIAGLFCLLCIPVGMIGLSLVFGILVLVAIYLIRGAPHLLRAVDRFPKVTSQYEADRAFTQTGGVRCGRSFWFSSNCTIPFAQFRVSKKALVLSVSVWRRTFTFPRSSIRHLRWKRALFSHELRIEYDVGDFPPFVLFWVSNREAMTQGLRDFGYQVSHT